ncbi:hypothetical protein IP88_01800 [alpha proteobacterium AAP81b]|nr:hypothetical protein IP88_01800 [alpha proteobacterium AAP81b]
MHPNPAFRSDENPLAFVAAHAFGHIFGVTPDGARVAHAPILVTADKALRFHLANANALTAHLDGARALVSLATHGSYISANWYADPAANVPTWQYRAVEIDGSARALSPTELDELLDLAAATLEPRVGENWTMAKMDPRRGAAMKRAITGFEIVPDTIRTTDKHGQNRSEADACAVIAGLEASGNPQGAAEMRRLRRW